MIFATLGNAPLPFDRLAGAVDRLAGSLDEEVIIQFGHTRWPFRSVQAFEFLGAYEMAKLTEEARVVIAHGGWGTVCECIRKGSRVVAVPRRVGVEHNHDQEQLVRALERKGHLIGVYDVANLGQAVAAAGGFRPNPLTRGRVPEIIRQYLESL